MKSESGGKTRNSNLELYRIIVMLLIVAHHFVMNSGLMEVMEQDMLSGKSVYLYLLAMWGKTCINCFVMITGYFMCTASATVRKFLKLMLEVLFYRIVIWTLFTLSGYGKISLMGMVEDLVPVNSISDGFTSCFLVFYLFIPFLNILVRGMNQRQHIGLIALCLFVYTFLGSIPKIDVTFNYVTWFSVLYIVSSYIRLYGLLPKLKNSHWGWLTVASAALAVLSVVAVLLADDRLGTKFNPYWLVSDANTLLALLVAVCSFMYFKDLPMRQSCIINTIGASTFGVLLIHASSDTMRQWLWCDVVDCAGLYYGDHLVLLSITSILLIFAVCIVVDYVRIHTIEKWTFAFIDRFLIPRFARGQKD